MAGRSIRGMCIPRKMREAPRGTGVVECSASGFLAKPDEIVDDVRQGPTAEKYADLTPGFGTYHPQDVKSLPDLSDPTPIPEGRPPTKTHFTKQEMGMTDREIELSIREGRPPRPGY